MFKWEKYNNNIYNFFLKKENANKTLFNFIETNFYGQIRDIFAITLSLISNNRRKINILDLGGGNGASLFNLKKKIHTRKFSFYIYDPFIDFEKPFKINNIRFFPSNDLKKFKKIKFDLVYLGSSYQYMRHFNFLFNQINFKKKSFVLFTHTPFSILDSFKDLQESKKNLLQNIHSFEETINFFKKKKFQVVFKSIMDNKYSGIQKKLLKKTIYLNLLLKKNKQ
jgi:hypothetical protein